MTVELSRATRLRDCARDGGVGQLEAQGTAGETRVNWMIDWARSGTTYPSCFAKERVDAVGV